jgi:hypothetical protein
MNTTLATGEGRAAWIEHTGGAPEQCPPIYSFDNPSIHTTGAVSGLRRLGLLDDQNKPTAAYLQLPPHSGDLHRTIERVHARICGAFQRWLDEDSTEYHIMGYCAKLYSIFITTQTSDVIHSCMFGKPDAHGNPSKHSLSHLYARVVELKGDIPPEHELR